MEKPLRRARPALLLITIGVLWSAGSPAADAGCVRAELIVHRQNDSTITVTSQHDCVVPTPWDEWAGVSYGHERTSPDGMPNGFSVGAWTVLP